VNHQNQLRRQETAQTAPEWAQRRHQGFLRIHHFLNVLKPCQLGRQAFWSAMHGIGTEDELDEMVARDAAALNFNQLLAAYISVQQFDDGEANYVYDRHGGRMLEGIKAQLWPPVRYAQRLRALPGRAVVKLGVSMDVICDTCEFANHCRALNIRRFAPRIPPALREAFDTVNGESSALGRVQQALTVLDQKGWATEWLVGSEIVRLRDAQQRLVPVEAPYLLMRLIRCSYCSTTTKLLWNQQHKYR
jgi:hypothetical protein